MAAQPVPFEPQRDRATTGPLIVSPSQTPPSSAGSPALHRHSLAGYPSPSSPSSPSGGYPYSPCRNQGCKKPSWNGSPAEVCSSVCKKILEEQGNADCRRPGCGKRSWNGKPNQMCSSACKKILEEQELAAGPSLKMQEQQRKTASPESEPSRQLDFACAGEADRLPNASESSLVAAPGSARPKPTTFESSTFRRYYGKEAGAITSIDGFWGIVHLYLVRLYTSIGKGNDDATEFAKRFSQDLRCHVESSDGIIDADMAQKLKTSVALVSARCWTSDRKDGVLEKEWCGLLQEGTRLDDESFFPHVAAIWATMNLFGVSNRHPLKEDEQRRDIPWPVINIPELGEERFILFRGGKLPQEHVKWYEEAIKNKQIYRVPMALPTSKSSNTAFQFMNQAQPLSAPKVQYRYRLDPKRRCKHVNCLEKVTTIKGELEFLLPPYSSFFPTDIKHVKDVHVFGMKESYYCIDIDIIFDNKSESEMDEQGDKGPVPDNVPLAPWA